VGIPVEKKPHSITRGILLASMGLARWDKRRLRLFPDRIEYGRMERGRFVEARHSPLPVNEQTAVQASTEGGPALSVSCSPSSGDAPVTNTFRFATADGRHDFSNALNAAKAGQVKAPARATQMTRALISLLTQDNVYSPVSTALILPNLAPRWFHVQRMRVG
jgi:hypothetical protein